MNIIPKMNPNDMAGVIGLMTFLTDADACSKRMLELKAATDEAVAEQTKAAQVVADAIEAAKKAAAVGVAAEAVKLEADTAHAAVMARVTDFDTRTGELVLAEKAHAKREADLDKRAKEIDDALAHLVSREEQVKVAEHAALELQYEYQGKMDALRSVVA